MLSVTVNAPKPHLLSSSFLPVTYFHPTTTTTTTKIHHLKPISATIIPSSPPPNPSQQKLYQPFRPPPSPIPPQYRSLDTNGRIEILSNRLGLWYEYASLIPALVQEGFVPSTIEELTGISGVEQNRLVVASKVRESLIQSKVDPETLEFFDKGGAEILYEIRLLSARERAAAARYLRDNNLDGRGAQELARAIKDFPRRRGDRGWEYFDYNLPGDCLSFMYYRQALEYQDSSDNRKNALEKAMEVAGSERARDWVLKGKNGEEEEKSGSLAEGLKVPVVRMSLGEVAEATIVVVLPVCGAEEREDMVAAAPWECGCKGDFGVLEAEKGWRKWVVLPAWEPVAGLKRGGVAVAFRDARALPWKVNRWYKEDAILVVADRGVKEVAADNGFYLVVGENENGGGVGGLKVERGSALKQKGVKESLGTVVLVVRPPREETENQLADEDWE